MMETIQGIIIFSLWEAEPRKKIKIFKKFLADIA